MNFFAVSGLLLGFITISFAVYFLVKGKTTTAKMWALFNLAVSVWGFGGFMIATTSDVNDAFFWWKATHVGIILIPVFFYHFTHLLLKIKRVRLLVIIYFLGIVFLYFNVFTDLFISNMRWVFNQFYYDSPPGIIYPYFTAFFFIVVIYSHYLAWKESRNNIPNNVSRNQLLIFYGVIAISYGGGSLSFLPVYDIDLYPAFNILTIVYGLTISYWLAKPQLKNKSPLTQKRFIRISSFLTALIIGMITYVLIDLLFPNIDQITSHITVILATLTGNVLSEKYFQKITTHHFTSSLGI